MTSGRLEYRSTTVVVVVDVVVMVTRVGVIVDELGVVAVATRSSMSVGLAATWQSTTMAVDNSLFDGTNFLVFQQVYLNDITIVKTM